MDAGLVGARPSIDYADWGIVPARYAHHTIRGNVFTDIGTGGIHSYKSPFTIVENNAIIRCNRITAGGAEKAGIKFVWFGNDIIVRNNYFYQNNNGHRMSALWMDAGSQGAQIYGNAFVENDHIWFERQLGPLTFTNNVVLNTGLRISDGGGVLMAHNLFARDTTLPPAKRNRSRRYSHLIHYQRNGLINPAYFEPSTLNQLGDALSQESDSIGSITSSSDRGPSTSPRPPTSSTITSPTTTPSSTAHSYPNKTVTETPPATIPDSATTRPTAPSQSASASMPPYLI